MKYRTKSIPVEAMQLNPENLVQVWRWTGTASTLYSEKECFILLDTVDGISKAVEGDYVVKMRGRLFDVVKPEIFESVYEKVDDEPLL